MSEPMFREGDVVTIKAKVLDVDTNDNTYNLASDCNVTFWVEFKTVEDNYPEEKAKQLKSKIEELTKELEELNNA